MPSRPNALLLVFLTALAGCGSETEHLFSEAAKAEREDNYEGAARLLRDIAIGFPESPFAAKAQLELARIHLLRTRDVPAAHGTLVEILDDYPESEVVPDAHHLLARLYQHEMQDPERAIPHYRAALQSARDPDRSREIFLSLGECYYRLEQLKEAAAAYEQAVALPYGAPADAAFFRLATLSQLASDQEGTLRWLEKLAARTEDSARRQTALLLQVETLLSLERFGDARYRLSQAERLAPGAPENADLHTRLEAAEGGRRPMDDESDSFLKLQERIHWGSGRRVN